MITRTNLNNILETGRLGNQMWAIASAIGIARRNNTVVYFLPWNYEGFFVHKLPDSRLDINYYIMSNKLRLYTEKSPYYQEINLDNSYAWDLQGYFQSYKYFEDCQNIIRSYFTPNFEMNNYSTELVSVHVRRGDYLELQDTHPVLAENYYREAMSLFPDDKFLIFSDDFEWAINCDWFDHDRCVFKAYEDILSPMAQDVYHMFYMAQCKSHIIANSSFSWWAAYLSNSPNKVVVAPKTWVLNEYRDDRVPTEWIRI